MRVLAVDAVALRNAFHAAWSAVRLMSDRCETAEPPQIGLAVRGETSRGSR